MLRTEGYCTCTLHIVRVHLTQTATEECSVAARSCCVCLELCVQIQPRVSAMFAEETAAVISATVVTICSDMVQSRTGCIGHFAMPGQWVLFAALSPSIRFPQHFANAWQEARMHRHQLQDCIAQRVLAISQVLQHPQTSSGWRRTLVDQLDLLA